MARIPYANKRYFEKEGYKVKGVEGEKITEEELPKADAYIFHCPYIVFRREGEIMKKFVLIVICLTLILSGCVYQSELRPEYNDTDVWVCEKPYAELYWSKSQGHTGIISYNDAQYNITHEETYGPLIWVYTTEATPFRNTDVPEEYWIFKGHANYGKDSLSIEIHADYKNIFNGELPTLNFKRYNKEEYLKNKEE